MFENKKIIILGIAKSGYEAAKLLVQYNNEIIINDLEVEANLEKAKELESLGVKVILGSHPENLINEDVDYLVKNPGVPETHEYVKKCRELNIPVVNEIEVAYSFLPKDVYIVGITGTNGKTTTTTLIYEILKRSQYQTHLAGNIGYPLSSIVQKVKSKDIIVIEISDHQLMNFDHFKTNISILLNLYEAHIDFHGSYDNYINIKKRIFNHLESTDYAIINYDNKDCLNITKDIKATKKYFSFNEQKDAYFIDDSIYVDNQAFINIANIKLIGMHNYENIMATILACNLLNIDYNIIIQVLKEFKGVEHRLEFVEKIGEIEFYNDSKSTNVTSTITALKSISNDTILILGGLDRDISFDDLTPYMDNVISVVCYGETKNKINNYCQSINKDCIVVDTLNEAVEIAYNYSKSKKTILFSPACASWDQFKDFETRGKLYKECIAKLK